MRPIALLALLMLLTPPAQAEVGVIAIAEDRIVSWGAAVRPERAEAEAEAVRQCEERFTDNPHIEPMICDDIRVIRVNRCFSIAVDVPLMRAIGYADEENLRMSKVLAQAACHRAGGFSCALQHVECVPPTAAAEPDAAAPAVE